MVQWIPIEKIQLIIHFEPFFIAWVFLLVAWTFYVFFLKKISEKRHANLKRRFLSTFIHLTISSLITYAHWFAFEHITQEALGLKFTNYLGLFALFIGAVAIIKIAQIFVYLYLFFAHMTHGVPILIGNMFTFIFSVVIFSLISSYVFEIHVATLLATSAIFSIVLGLALQDTLGNFFSGVALQIDRPFEIGDWIEVHNDKNNCSGQIQEITWRATFLLSFANELIMIPNRTIAQSEILLLSHQNKTARFNHAFRFHFGVNIQDAKDAIFKGISSIPEILTNPEPRVLILETTDSYILMKVFYSLSDYGTRYRIGDQVIQNILNAIQSKGLILAVPTIAINRD